MRDRWVGLQIGIDAQQWARLLRRAHDAALRSGHAPSIVRTVIADSWERCTGTGVDPGEVGAPLVIHPDETHERWREHPLSRMTAVLLGVLGNVLHDARHIVAVSDADGCLLWSDGHPDLLNASESIRFCPGYAWSEDVTGTNAVGTALAADHAVQVFSAEHFRAEVHGWQCSAAPVHDPDSRRTLGAIDVSGTYRTAHPHTLVLVELAARLVEEQLRREMLERDARILALFAEHTARHGGPAAALSRTGRVLAATPASWATGRLEPPSADGTVAVVDEVTSVAQPLGEGLLIVPARPSRRRARAPVHQIAVMGRDRATLTTATGSHRLTRRHSEIVTILALHPDGLESADLASLLYEEDGHEAATRAELHRLRKVLGPAFASRPYRLVDTAVDVCSVETLVSQGRIGDADALHPGPLLPTSTVPFIACARQRIAAQLSIAHPVQARAAVHAHRHAAR